MRVEDRWTYSLPSFDHRGIGQLLEVLDDVFERVLRPLRSALAPVVGRGHAHEMDEEMRDKIRDRLAARARFGRELRDPLDWFLPRSVKSA